MNILHINVTYQYGSTGKIVNAIHQSLLNHDHQSIVAYGRYFREASHTYKIGHLANNLVHGIHTRLFDRHGFASKNATKKFIRDIDFEQFDVIHLHNIHGYYINVKMLFKELKRVNKPVVWTLHDSWSYTGHCASYEFAGCNKWVTGCNHCPETKSYPISILLDQSKRNYAEKKAIFRSLKNLTLVTPSLWLKNEVNMSYLSDFPLKHIYNGVDLTRFKPIENRQSNEKFTIIGVASIWEKTKGLDYFNQLRNLLSDDYEIIIVGKIPSHFQRNSKIKYILRTESVEKLAELYSQADCFINPSLNDNLPTTTIEALACGTPVITFNTGGSKEIIDSTCGYLVDKKDINSIMVAIDEIKKNGKLYYEKSAHERSKFFDKNTMISNYQKLYEELIK